MIRSSLKTFFKNLIFIFVPMGIIYFFFVLILLSVVQSALSEATSTLISLGELVQTTTSDTETTVYDYFSYVFSQMDWSGNFLYVIRELLDSNWLYNTTIGFFETLNVAADEFGAQAYNIVNSLVGVLTALLTTAVTAFVFVLLLANLVTRWVLRYNNARRGISKIIIAWVVQSTVVVAVLGIAVYLIALWQPSAAIMAAVYIIVISFTAMLSAWLIHGRSKVKFRAVINGRNMAGYFLSSVLIIVICVVFFALIWLLFGMLATVLVALPVLIYAGNIINVNADTYVLSLALTEDDKTSKK